MLTVKDKTIKIYDSTLRDGAQTKGVNFSIDDKFRILDILMILVLTMWKQGGQELTQLMINFLKICLLSLKQKW